MSAYAYTEKHLGPKEEIGTKGSSHSIRLLGDSLNPADGSCFIRHLRPLLFVT